MLKLGEKVTYRGQEAWVCCIIAPESKNPIYTISGKGLFKNIAESNIDSFNTLWDLLDDEEETGG